MQLTLDDKEAQVLADAVRSRLDQIGASIARSDTRSFRDEVTAEGDMLEAVYRRLGCEYPEWSEVKNCEVKHRPESDIPEGATPIVLDQP